VKRNYSLKILRSKAVQLTEVTQLKQKLPETKSKSQRNSQIKKVVTRWDYTEEVSPAFRRLMLRLLLEPSPQLNNKKGMSDEAS